MISHKSTSLLVKNSTQFSIQMAVVKIGEVERWSPFPSLQQYELWCLSGSKREDYQNCSVLYCVLKLCTVISTLRWAVLTVLWIDWVLSHWAYFAVHRFICVYLCVFCVFCFILHMCCIVSAVGRTWWNWSLILRTSLPSVLWHCWLGQTAWSPIWPIMCLVGR